jgi:inner membrane protein
MTAAGKQTARYIYGEDGPAKRSWAAGIGEGGAMDWLSGMASQIEPWHWLALGLVLLAGELATGTTYLIWPAAAAWLTGLVLLFAPVGLTGQLAIFAGVTLVSSLTGRHYLRGRWLGAGKAGDLNDIAAQMIGQAGAVEQAPVNGIGQVRIGDTVWRAHFEAGDAVPGDRVEVIGLDGATLQVRAKPRA